MRSVFYPLLGDRIYGFWGNMIDVVAVIATLFGLASSLGFGVKQVSAGLNFLFNSPDNTGFKVVLIAVITGLATLSVVAGACVLLVSIYSMRRAFGDELQVIEKAEEAEAVEERLAEMQAVAEEVTS